MIIRFHLKNGLRLDQPVNPDTDYTSASPAKVADRFAVTWQGASLVRINPEKMPATIVPVCNILRIEVLNEQPDPA